MSTQIIVASDTHGASQLLPLLEKAYPEADAYLHCGDLEDDPRMYLYWIFVGGNNDFFFDAQMPEERVVSVNGVRVFMTHSHRFSYYRREEQIVAKAKEKGCQIAVYGHTHVPSIVKRDGVWLINPGSMRLPRDGRSGCYAVIEVDNEGHISAGLFHEEDWPFESPIKPFKWRW